MKKKILIVEDEKLLTDVLVEEIKGAGFDTSIAYDGKVGLEKALAEHPDLILLDIVMPVMDGMTMLNELRKDKWGADVPVVMLTNLSDSSKVAEAAKNKTYDYLVKADWPLEEVIKKINERLGIES